MTNQELNQLAELTARRTANIVIKKLQEMHFSEANEMVDAKEAARILGVTHSYLRQIKERFSYVKIGENKQARLMFPKAELLNYYKHINSYGN